MVQINVKLSILFTIKCKVLQSLFIWYIYVIKFFELLVTCTESIGNLIKIFINKIVWWL